MQRNRNTDQSSSPNLVPKTRKKRGPGSEIENIQLLPTQSFLGNSCYLLPLGVSCHLLLTREGGNVSPPKQLRARLHTGFIQKSRSLNILDVKKSIVLLKTIGDQQSIQEHTYAAVLLYDAVTPRTYGHVN